MSSPFEAHMYTFPVSITLCPHRPISFLQMDDRYPFSLPLFFISSLSSSLTLEMVPTPPNTSAVYTIATLAPASNTSSACRPFVMPPEAKITVLGFALVEAVTAVGPETVSAGAEDDEEGEDEDVRAGEDEGRGEGN